MIARSGEALSLRLGDGRDFVVTVPDAATGAEVLNALAARARGRVAGGED